MSYTRGQWARAFLVAAGNASPDTKIIEWVANWTRFETSAGGGAAYNLLNTIQAAPGATVFNYSGVRNFVSFEQGTSVNAAVLGNGRYTTLHRALVTNNLATLGILSPINSNLDVWGTGPKASAILASLGQGMNDTFPGNGPSPITPPGQDVYVVEPGDSLWVIASELHLKGGWPALYNKNRDVIGDNPDLIYPGQRLDYAGLI